MSGKAGFCNYKLIRSDSFITPQTKQKDTLANKGFSGSIQLGFVYTLEFFRLLFLFSSGSYRVFQDTV